MQLVLVTLLIALACNQQSFEHQSNRNIFHANGNAYKSVRFGSTTVFCNYYRAGLGHIFFPLIYSSGKFTFGFKAAKTLLA